MLCEARVRTARWRSFAAFWTPAARASLRCIVLGALMPSSGTVVYIEELVNILK